MKLTRERKVYVAVLSAAGAIWSLDQFVLSGGPQSAHAGVIVQPLSTPGAPASADAANLALSTTSRAVADRVPHPTLASRLEALSRSLEQIEAPPAPTGLFDQPAWARPPAATPKPAETYESPRTPFGHQYELTSIMGGPTGKLIVVNGRPLKLGQSLDGYVLTAIDNDAAIFVRQGVEARLQLNRARASQPALTPPDSTPAINLQPAAECATHS